MTTPDIDKALDRLRETIDAAPKSYKTIAVYVSDLTAAQARIDELCEEIDDLQAMPHGSRILKVGTPTPEDLEWALSETLKATEDRATKAEAELSEEKLANAQLFSEVYGLKAEVTRLQDLALEYAGDVTMRDMTISNLRAQLARAVDVIAPFARESENYPNNEAHYVNILGASGDIERASYTVQSLRAAAAFVKDHANG